MARQSKPARRRKRRGDRFIRYALAAIVAALAVIVFVLWGPSGKALKPAGKPQPARATKEGPAADRAGDRAKKAAPDRTGEKRGLVAVVIDDLGPDLQQARAVLALSGKVTVSVMPGLAHSRKIAELARSHGREVLLHLPMEAKNNAGKRQAVGTLRSDMTPMEFMTTLADDIASVPGAVGVNNHEGSALTENSEAMKFLMAELKARDLRFLDSLTSPRSVAYATAKEFGLRAAQRDVFLDNDGDNPASIRKQLAELAGIARRHGSAIGIGHPREATITELKKWLAEAGDQGIEIVPVSRLMK